MTLSSSVQAFNIAAERLNSDLVATYGDANEISFFLNGIRHKTQRLGKDLIDCVYEKRLIASNIDGYMVTLVAMVEPVEGGDTCIALSTPCGRDMTALLNIEIEHGSLHDVFDEKINS